MSQHEPVIAIAQALKLADTINELAKEAQFSGQKGVSLPLLQAAFSALDLAEAELDAAIDEAE